MRGKKIRMTCKNNKENIYLAWGVKYMYKKNNDMRARTQKTKEAGKTNALTELRDHPLFNCLTHFIYWLFIHTQVTLSAYWAFVIVLFGTVYFSALRTSSLLMIKPAYGLIQYNGMNRWLRNYVQWAAQGRPNTIVWTARSKMAKNASHSWPHDAFEVIGPLYACIN
jgi:hypothetical protein